MDNRNSSLKAADDDDGNYKNKMFFYQEQWYSEFWDRNYVYTLFLR